MLWIAEILELRDLSRGKSVRPGARVVIACQLMSKEERRDFTACGMCQTAWRTKLRVSQHWEWRPITAIAGDKLNNQSNRKRENTKFSFCHVLFYLSRGKGYFSRDLEM